MRNSTCIRLSVIGLLLGLGVLLCGRETPLASRSALGGQSEAGAIIRGEGVLAPTGYEEIRCLAEQPRAVLFIARPDQAVKKDDLLVEFDAFALTSERQDQEIRVMKAEADLMTVEASLPGAKQAAEEAVAIAEKALRMATQRLEGYRTGEFPTQQTAAINEVVIAEERAAMWKRRSQEAQAACEEQGTKELEQELQETRLASSQADADLALARDRLKLLKEMEYPQRVEELELTIAQRKLEVLRARNELAQTTREGQANILIARAIRQMESARSELLSEQIRASRLYAPRDGTVFSSDDVLFGTAASPVWSRGYGSSRPGAPSPLGPDAIEARHPPAPAAGPKARPRPPGGGPPGRLSHPQNSRPRHTCRSPAGLRRRDRTDRGHRHGPSRRFGQELPTGPDRRSRVRYVEVRARIMSRAEAQGR